MSTYDELKNEFDENVKKLRAECTHPDISDWIDEYWAPAHSTGYKVKICNICKKEVERIPPKSDGGHWLKGIPPLTEKDLKKIAKEHIDKQKEEKEK